MVKSMLIYFGSLTAFYYGLQFAIAAPTLFQGVDAILGRLAGLAVALSGLIAAYTGLLGKSAANGRKIMALTGHVDALTRQNGEQAATILELRNRTHLLGDHQQRTDAMVENAEHDAAERAKAQVQHVVVDNLHPDCQNTHSNREAAP